MFTMNKDYLHLRLSSDFLSHQMMVPDSNISQ